MRAPDLFYEGVGEINLPLAILKQSLDEGDQLGKEFKQSELAHKKHPYPAQVALWIMGWLLDPCKKDTCGAEFCEDFDKCITEQNSWVRIESLERKKTRISL